jgi:hypothetical protein
VNYHQFPGDADFVAFQTILRMTPCFQYPTIKAQIILNNLFFKNDLYFNKAEQLMLAILVI